MTCSKKKEPVQRLLDTQSKEKEEALFARLAQKSIWQCPTIVWMRGLSHIDENTFPADPRLDYIPTSWVAAWRVTKEERLLAGRSAEDIAAGKRYFQALFDLIKTAHRAGVPFLAGTDTPAPYVFPGSSLHEELVLLVEAGPDPHGGLTDRDPAILPCTLTNRTGLAPSKWARCRSRPSRSESLGGYHQYPENCGSGCGWQVVLSQRLTSPAHCRRYQCAAGVTDSASEDRSLRQASLPAA